MGFGPNLKEIRKMRGLSVKQLADKTGLKRQSIYDWEDGDITPRKENIDKLVRVLQIKVEDLFREGNASKHTSVKTTRTLIPFYDNAIAVGGHQLMADQTPIFKDGQIEYIDPGDLLRPATGTLRIYGHSMFPKYPAGCIVAFKDADKEVIFWGEDYVLEMEDRRIIKRLEKSTEKGYVSAVSYNKSEEYVYAPVEIPINKIRRLYMVLGKVELEASI